MDGTRVCYSLPVEQLMPVRVITRFWLHKAGPYDPPLTPELILAAAEYMAEHHANLMEISRLVDAKFRIDCEIRRLEEFIVHPEEASRWDEMCRAFELAQQGFFAPGDGPDLHADEEEDDDDDDEDEDDQGVGK